MGLVFEDMSETDHVVVGQLFVDADLGFQFHLLFFLLEGLFFDELGCVDFARVLLGQGVDLREPPLTLVRYLSQELPCQVLSFPRLFGLFRDYRPFHLSLAEYSNNSLEFSVYNITHLSR